MNNAFCAGLGVANDDLESPEQVISVRSCYRGRVYANAQSASALRAPSRGLHSARAGRLLKGLSPSRGGASVVSVGLHNISDRAVAGETLQTAVLLDSAAQQQQQQQQQQPVGAEIHDGCSTAAMALSAVDAIVLDDVVIDDKFVSPAVKNTAVALGDDVRGYGSDAVRATSCPPTSTPTPTLLVI